MSPSLWRSLLCLLCLVCLIFSSVAASPLAQLDPKLRAIIESDPELMAEVATMMRAGTFPGVYDSGRLFNYQRLGK
ncbi:hypothetical protein PRIPAC_90419 [Pristionchus pacificus]|uniref:Uncharacterized protein n=1 Tax=Pristionchus pacificus TaxID=54126 RepID=A0A454XJM6_PRIPA|nr:hypothetical protein PRIPAC_90419 [Pristionchus pacificus]|eukprot:PDM62530.1 hypothetical protein PRIPAC_51972 [Pristionchus pacificus]